MLVGSNCRLLYMDFGGYFGAGLDHHKIVFPRTQNIGNRMFDCIDTLDLKEKVVVDGNAL